MHLQSLVFKVSAMGRESTGASMRTTFMFKVIDICHN